MFKKKGLTVVSISIDRGNNATVKKLIKKYVDRRGLTFVNLIDPGADTADSYGVRGVPMTFFISPQGRVIAFASGYRKWDGEEGVRMIEQLLSEAGQKKGES